MRICSIKKRLLVFCCLLVASACTTVRDVQPPQAQAVVSAPTLSVYEHRTPADSRLIAAEESLHRQIEAQPDDIAIQLRLAALYRHLEQFEQAEQILQRALVLSDNDVTVRNEQAILQRCRGQFEAARQTYVAILNQQPDFYLAHYNLGILFDLYLQDPAQAQMHYSAYLDAAPQADEQVSKWLADLQRRFDLDVSTSVVSTHD